VQRERKAPCAAPRVKRLVQPVESLCKEVTKRSLSLIRLLQDLMNRLTVYAEPIAYPLKSPAFLS